MEEKNITIKNQYKLGEILGKGGWGTVYKAWDQMSGNFVAVKEVSLAQIPKEMLGGIMSEITLLQSLEHPKIVRYIDSVKTDSALYIVLEYVENGSLEWIVKKFGKFPEHLIANYIHQVLEGLVYLHEQGVIHRDIKGANILTTKMGQVKLADFGVATRRGAGESDESEPAGSPYWMAPEIIEMNGATTKSDIWSVGCTIIELVTGNPPYFELDAMPALFRIVQDDCPPIPDNISALLRDFLMNCFKKETFLRSSADQLLKHRWLAAYSKKPEAPSSNVVSPTTAIPQDAVEDYNKKLLAKREEMKAAEVADASKPAKMGSTKRSKPKTRPKLPVLVQSDEESDSDWDDSFDINDFKFPGAPASSNQTAPAKAATSNEDDDENWDDIDFNAPATSTKSGTSVNTGLASLQLKPQTNTSQKEAKKPRKAADSDEESWDDFSPKTPPSTHGKKSSFSLKKDDYNDDNLDDLGGALDSKTTSSGPLDLASKLASKMQASWDANSVQAVEDPFDMFDEESETDFDSFTLEETLVKDEVARFTSSAIRAIEGLNSLADEESILQNCERLATIFKEHPSEKSHIIGRTGVIPFVEMLLMPSPKVVHAILKMINIIVEDGPIRESFSVMGGIATTLQYANRKYSRPIRQEASVFIQQMLSAGKKTMKMFIGARGLPVLVDFISVEEDYTQNKDLYLIGIDCIYSTLTSNLQVRIPKNDFCRLFARCSLLPHLARAMEFVTKDPATRNSYSDKIAEIFVIFSKGDSVVKSHFCEADVLKRLLNILPDLAPPTFLKILKCIAALSNSPNTLEPLQAAGAIKTLVPFMGRRDGQLMMETHQQLFSALYNLCRLDGNRQLQAAKAGIIPHLQWVVVENHPLKQFALPILFEMARTKKTRAELMKTNGITFFMDLLRQHYPWQVQAMDSLSEWVVDDKKTSLVIEQHIDQIVDVFSSATSDEVLSGILEPLHKMITHSKALNRALSKSNIVNSVIAKLSHHNALIRVNLLKILKSFFETHQKPTEMIAQYQLQGVVKKLESDQKVLVSEMARELSKEFAKAIRRDSSSKGELKDKESKKSMSTSSSASSLSSNKGDNQSSSSSSTLRKGK